MLTAAHDLSIASRPVLSIRPDAALRAILADGPMLSRDVLAALAADGLSDKQVRRAREKLGVIIERSGSGKTMRSTWRLPSQEPAAPPAPASKVHRQATTGSRAEAQSSEADGARAAPHDASLSSPPPSEALAINPADTGDPHVFSDVELQRVHRRVEVFEQRGMERQAALKLAHRLVQVRDRSGRPDAGGSCVECQAFLRDQCVSSPKALGIVHYCIYMRHDAP